MTSTFHVAMTKGKPSAPQNRSIRTVYKAESWSDAKRQAEKMWPDYFVDEQRSMELNFHNNISIGGSNGQA